MGEAAEIELIWDLWNQIVLISKTCCKFLPIWQDFLVGLAGRSLISPSPWLSPLVLRSCNALSSRTASLSPFDSSTDLFFKFSCHMYCTKPDCRCCWALEIVRAAAACGRSHCLLPYSRTPHVWAATSLPQSSRSFAVQQSWGMWLLDSSSHRSHPQSPGMALDAQICLQAAAAIHHPCHLCCCFFLHRAS